jgi:hypothetical protein
MPIQLTLRDWSATVPAGGASEMVPIESGAY